VNKCNNCGEICDTGVNQVWETKGKYYRCFHCGHPVIISNEINSLRALLERSIPLLNIAEYDIKHHCCQESWENLKQLRKDIAAALGKEDK
jgi:DNA-directed RNA polymerase subunit RPC12/RpoP